MGDRIRIQVLADKLLGGNATQQDRDELTAMIAISMRELKDDIDDRIARVHLELCEKCSLRKRLEKIETKCKATIAANEANNAANKGRGLSMDKLPWIIVAGLVAIIAALLGIDLKGIL